MGEDSQLIFGIVSISDTFSVICHLQAIVNNISLYASSSNSWSIHSLLINVNMI